MKKINLGRLYFAYVKNSFYATRYSKLEVF